MTPITWQAAIDDEEQRPLLQDILEAAVHYRNIMCVIIIVVIIRRKITPAGIKISHFYLRGLLLRLTSGAIQ